MPNPLQKKSVLYITYDGILEPLGQSQILAYLEELSLEYNIFLLSYEKRLDLQNKDLYEKINQRIATSKINWTSLNYHHKLSAISTTWDILHGIMRSIKIIRLNDINIIHSRSYVSSVIALALKRICKKPFIFDMRGFWANERVDGGLWKKNSFLFLLAKWFEKKFLLSADHIVSLTHAGVKAIKSFDYLRHHNLKFSIIPTCANLDFFKPVNLKKGPFTLGYVGSVGLWYDFDAALICFRELKKRVPDSKFLIINKHEHDFIKDRIEFHGLRMDSIKLISADFDQIPAFINQMDAGIFFIKPLFSKQASAPTKLAEFLGCGVPCLSNHGIGDMSEIFENYKVGIAIDNFSEMECKRGVDELLKLTKAENISNICTLAAEKVFSLQTGVQSYKEIYETLN